MPKHNNKGYIIIDPFEDKVMDRIFNDLLDYPVVEYNPNVHGGDWINVSKKIGIRCKEIIDKGLMNPTTVARTRNINIISIPKGSSIETAPVGKKKKILFNRKIF